MTPSKELPEFLFHATPAWRWEAIANDGLVATAKSAPNQAPCVYLGIDVELARHYADMNFGEEQACDWVVLRIRSADLDPDALWGDCGQEAEMAFDDFIEPLGFTIRDTWGWKLPWWATLHATGQITYRGHIGPEHIELLERIVPDAPAPTPRFG